MISRPSFSFAPFVALALLLFAACGTHPYLVPSTKLESATDASPVGERWYRMELTSGQRLGFMHMKVEAAEAASKAAYQVKTRGVFAMGPVEMEITETALLDGGLAVLSLEGEKRSQAPDKEATAERTRLTRSDHGWERQQKGKTTAAAVDVPFYDVTPGLALLLERLPLRDGATWTLPSLAWKDGQPGEKASARTLTLEVREARFQHHEAEVDGFMVTITKDDRPGRKDLIHTDASGRMLRLTASDAPIRLVACSEDEARKEEVLAPVDPTSPEYPFSRFLEVVGGQAKTDVLDEIVDWDAIINAVAKEKGEDPPPPEARDELIAQFKAGFGGMAQNKLDPKMIRMIVGMINIEIDGDRARITSPGAGKKPFVAERRGDHWVLVTIPR